ncbi:phosphotransferase [Nocardioides sp.]|uniref:phosphotransferase family protein n=1 Tax=Nocardioides sp. TaxID=35761 RepID=UPI00286E59CF|nr:phosphotransferase [Nocardioides sp.]
MNRIAALRDELAGAGLRLRKAQPRGPGRLIMELDAPDARVCAGQWHADATETYRAAAGMRDRFGDDSVQVLAGGEVLVQHAGADHKLSALRDLVAAPDASLVAHRPERRAVVRVGVDRYLKVVRPGRTAGVVLPLEHIRAEDLQLPKVLDSDDRRGLVTLAALPGTTLHQRLADPTTDDDELARDATRVGVVVRSLHAQGPVIPHKVHDAAAEIAATSRWLDAATSHGLLDPAAWRPVLDRVGSRLPEGPHRPALLHRDLHDKQLILNGAAPVGLLDLDLAAYGDPAVDLANLVVHLDLRVRQGVCSERRAARCSAALLDGYSPDRDLLARMVPYAAITRLRLAGVYCFRDAPAGLVSGLLRDAAEVL